MSDTETLDTTAESEEPIATNPIAPEQQDIDPGQWLQASSGLIIAPIQTRGGILKVAALTEEETDMIRRASESIDPTNPRGPRKLNIKKLRLGTVAASMNKAYGYTPADPRFLTPDKLNTALSGELTTIVNKITEIGGFVEEDQGRSLDSLFQVS